jgi:oligopeptidase B
MVQPPLAPQHPHVHTEHGVERPDPFAWMKDKFGEESLAYLRAERDYYDTEMRPLGASVEELTAEMASRVAPVEESARWREGHYDYFTRTPEGSEHGQLWRVGSDGTEVLLLDQNDLRGDSSYVEVGVSSVSPDGRLLAYSVDVTGDEVYELRFRDLTTGVDLSDQVAHTYYGGAWSRDSSTFFYVVHDDAYRPYQVWRHRIGTPSTSDTLVFEDLDQQYDVVVWGDRAGRYVVIHSSSRNTSEVWLADAHRPDEPAWVVSPRRRGTEYRVAHVPGSRDEDTGHLLVVTNHGAEEFRLMRAPVASSEPEQWHEVLPESPDIRLHDVDVFAGHVVLSTVSGGEQLLQVLSLSALENQPSLDAVVVVDSGIPGGLLTLWHNEEPGVADVLVEVESYVQPAQWWRIALDTGERALVKSTELPHYRADDYLLELSWITARDGEQVPVKLARRRDIPLDGTAPVLLYGYGAYESSFWPGFDVAIPSLLDRGVVFAHALIRGGGERGRRWYVAGRLLTKRNTFTDFIDAADQLEAQGLVDGSRIVSRGLSAGGLLQGAVYALRPDRWRAVVAEVPFVDVVTTMFDHDVPLTVTELDEWGDPRNKDEFDYLLSYSPYENVPERNRPELLVTGALHDPRVMIHEPAKWVARIRSTAQPGDARTLFRAELGEGGHTGPTGRYAHLAYEAEVAAFILQAMGKLPT